MQKDLTGLSTKPSRFWFSLGSISEKWKKIGRFFTHVKGLMLDPFPVLKTLSYFMTPWLGPYKICKVLYSLIGTLRTI